MSDKLKTATFGMVFALMGVFIMAMMALYPEGANAPGWVVVAAGGCFLCAGLSVVAQAFGLLSLGRALGVLVVYLLAVPPLWILFAGEDQSCSVSIGFLGAFVEQASAWGCRGVFGFGGLLTLLMAFGFTWASLRRRAKTTPASAESANPGE